MKIKFHVLALAGLSAAGIFVVSHFMGAEAVNEKNKVAAKSDLGFIDILFLSRYRLDMVDVGSPCFDEPVILRGLQDGLLAEYCYSSDIFDVWMKCSDAKSHAFFLDYNASYKYKFVDIGGALGSDSSRPILVSRNLGIESGRFLVKEDSLWRNFGFILCLPGQVYAVRNGDRLVDCLPDGVYSEAAWRILEFRPTVEN